MSGNKVSGKDFLNWAQLSRVLSGTSRVVRRNMTPKKHELIINELVEAIETVLKKHGVIE